MTIRYQTKVANASFTGLSKLLLRWKGSVYKLMFRELFVFAFLYAVVSVIYRLALNQEQRLVFERMCIYIDETVNHVPLTFVLGFYVTFVISRWWEQLIAYPWPDRMCYLITHYINGKDERSYMYRRQLARYISTATIFVNRPYSVLTKKRFPTLQHMVDAGLLTKEELILFEDITEIKEHGKFWVPCVWFTKLLDQARQEGLMCDASGMGSKQILDELLVFRALLGRNWMYNWVTIPVSYTQVVTLATYTYFIGCLFARQPLDPSKGYKGHAFDVYVPIFTVFQFVFYVGWLKVAETLINPWGEDDDDFDINWFIERHMQVHFTVVDQMFEKVPPLVKDRYWGVTKVQLPPLNSKREALKPGECIPGEYIDAIGRQCQWPNLQSSTTLRNRSPKPSTTTTAMSSVDPNSSNDGSPGLLPRQLIWDGSPIFPPGHNWYLK